MKTSFLLFLTLFSFSLIAQQQSPMKEHISENEVSSVIIESFENQHPGIEKRRITATTIYYWYADATPHWYSNWYPDAYVNMNTPAKYVVVEHPQYYEFAFTDADGRESIALISRYGAWIETRTKLNELPEPVLAGLAESKYGQWTVGKHKEMISMPGAPNPIYRFRVAKGLKWVIIRFDEQGSLVQEKKPTKLLADQ